VFEWSVWLYTRRWAWVLLILVAVLFTFFILIFLQGCGPGTEYPICGFG